MNAVVLDQKNMTINLPPRLRARTRHKKKFYYYDTGDKSRKEIPLESDYALSLKKWTELEIDAPPPSDSNLI